MRKTYPDALWIDLLQSEQYRRYLDAPGQLAERIAAAPTPPFVVIDEVQKVPALLDEVHWLIENRGIFFGLCGSSARRVRRGGSNLLGGRALRYELAGLTAAELGANFDLVRMLNHGPLPRIYLAAKPQPLLAAYAADYLREEVAAEGLTRNLPAFSGFLNAAALSDGDPVNYTNIARECGVSSTTVKGYFQILVDTLLGSWLPSYRKRPKRRVAQAPKFYFGDVGVVNFLARRSDLQPGSELFGKAFENWCFHELSTYNAYSQRFSELSFWRLTSGIEVDFIVDDCRLAIEVKASARIGNHHLKGLRQLAVDQPQVARRAIVCLEPHPRRTDDGIDILPWQALIARLWAGELF